ncbi:hypothetical protein HOP50_01g04150 [Chloropicon primus]|nr:hypothetical protein HOP50_01g04150 [Chloropicon primus]
MSCPSCPGSEKEALIKEEEDAVAAASVPRLRLSGDVKEDVKHFLDWNLDLLRARGETSDKEGEGERPAAKVATKSASKPRPRRSKFSKMEG